MSVHVGPHLAKLYADPTCAMCLDPLGNADLTVGLCGHAFHATCVKELVLHKGATVGCPLCKQAADTFLDTFPANKWDTPEHTFLREREKEALRAGERVTAVAIASEQLHPAAARYNSLCV